MSDVITNVMIAELKRKLEEQKETEQKRIEAMKPLNTEGYHLVKL